jgi:tripartite-type tricarboxylate transporter receptor subunit TctC
VIAKLNQEVGAALRDTEVRARFSTLGVDPLGGSVADAESFLRAEVDKWSKLIRAKNLRQN